MHIKDSKYEACQFSESGQQPAEPDLMEPHPREETGTELHSNTSVIEDKTSLSEKT